MIALGFITVPFVLISIYFLSIHFLFKRYGQRVRGKIVGVEKYISRTNTSSSRTSSIMYAPIVSFVSNSGEEIYVQSGSKNIINYQIGDRLDILRLHHNDRHIKFDNKTHLIFGIIFGFFGFGGHATFLFSNENSVVTKVLISSLIFILPLLLKRILVKKRLWSKVKDSYYSNTKTINKDELNEKDIFWSNQDILKEQKAHSKIGLAISFIFFFIILFIYNLIWKKLSLSSKEVVTKLIQSPMLLTQESDPLIFIFLSGLLFVPACLYSLWYSYKRL
ncbi:hypothetical protein HBN50_14980 [Halobacteriovorax sp. GB3]|uniref:DUF3592 domain-containing protein n=1 Tax=Halobacteriovorax sp. GB3 TaxID=2719615 RepID=UPI002361B090|nr:DUF3592 domain-containing protein [Halobacteriovorax sp. GB3]MDD0854414.1 hypothetical protein [Halobacteriovorax sp. GB3]